MVFRRKYGVLLTGGTVLRIPILVAGSADQAGSGDWTPAAGDVKVSKDGGAEANIGTLPTATNNAWHFILSATELQAKQVTIRVVDSATKAVDDQFIIVETYGHASAMHPVDPEDVVRMAMTALPNAAADAAGGLVISDAGGLDLDAKLANTNEVTAARMATLTDWIDGGRLDLILDARASQSSVDTVEEIVDEILLDTVEIGTAGAGLTSIPWNPDWDAEVQSECDDALDAFVCDTDIGLAKLGEIVAALAAGKVSVSSVAGVTTITYKKRDGSTTSFTTIVTEADNTRATTGALS
jgi:hypothetical protein